MSRVRVLKRLATVSWDYSVTSNEVVLALKIDFEDTAKYLKARDDLVEYLPDSFRNTITTVVVFDDDFFYILCNSFQNLDDVKVLLRDTDISVLTEYLQSSDDRVKLSQIENAFQQEKDRTLIIVTAYELTLDYQSIWQNAYAQGIDFVAVGVELSSLDSLNIISSHTYDVKNLKQIPVLQQAAPVSLNEIRSHSVSMQVYVSNSMISKKNRENLDLLLKIRSTGRDTIPKGLLIETRPNQYFEGAAVTVSRPVDEEFYEVRLSLKPKQIVKLRDVPKLIFFSASHPDIGEVPTNPNSTKITSELFVKDLIDHPFPIKEIQYLNVLVFGTAGCGKSSFINSSLSLFSPTLVAPAPVRDKSDHVTRQIKRYSITDLGLNIGWDLSFFDIWGVDSKNFQGSMLYELLDGTIPENTVMTNSMDGVVINTISTARRRVHCVLLFVSSMILDGGEATLSPLRQHIHTCRSKYSITPIIVATRAKTLGSAEAQRKQQKAIASALDINDNVFMIENYTSHKEKSIDIDIPILKVLKAAIRVGLTYQKSNEKSLRADLNHERLSTRVSRPDSIPHLSQPILGSAPPFDASLSFSSLSISSSPPSVPSTESLSTSSTLLCPTGCGTILKSTFKKCPKCKYILQ